MLNTRKGLGLLETLPEYVLGPRLFYLVLFRKGTLKLNAGPPVVRIGSSWVLGRPCFRVDEPKTLDPGKSDAALKVWPPAKVGIPKMILAVVDLLSPAAASPASNGDRDLEDCAAFMIAISPHSSTCFLSAPVMSFYQSSSHSPPSSSCSCETHSPHHRQRQK